jgi:hypothetical protein
MSSNVEKPLKPAEQQRHSRSFELKVANRRRRVFELRCLGYKIPQIKEKLAEEKQFWSEDTIKADLHSGDASAYLEELERQQFADIALEDDRKVKLEFRDRMIERLTPRKSPDPAIVNNVNQQVTVNQQDNLLEEYADAINQAAAVNQNIPALCTGEPLDSKASASVDGEKRTDFKANPVPMPT